MRYRLATLLAALSGFSMAAGIILAGDAMAGRSVPAKAVSCQEDRPCWNWRTMGNGDRGIVAVAPFSRWATFRYGLVVDGPTFDRMQRAGRIDWQRTPTLRGDH